MTANSALRAASATLATAPLLLLSACAVPLAPGYRVERQQVEVRYLASPAHLRIRATYRLRNIGNADLNFIEATLPDEQAFGRQNLRTQVEGRDVSLQPTGEAGAPSVRVPFDPPWPQKQRRNLVFEYDLAPTLPGHAAVAVNDGSFHIRHAAAFPVLRSPKGVFAKGGEQPHEIDLVVQAPADFRVFASGRQQHSRRRGGEAEQRFRIPEKGEEPFVVAGRYQEQQIRASGDAFVFWTLEPLPADPAQVAGARLAAALQTFRAAFGPLWKSPPPVRVIETPARLTRRAAGSRDAAGVALSAGALLNRQAFALGVSSDAFLDLVEHELAHTWFGQVTAPRPEVDPALGEGLAEYAAVVAAEARGGEAARRSRAALLLRWFDESCKQAQDKPLLRLEPSDPFEQRVFGYSKGALFFLALEDRYGKENVRRALAHLVRSLRGSRFGFAELRSALELETKQNLGDFFRLWLDQTGIPADVRNRYEDEDRTTWLERWEGIASHGLLRFPWKIDLRKRRMSAAVFQCLRCSPFAIFDCLFQSEAAVRELISTDRGPKAIGPYSQAIKANGFIFVSGQIPLDPRTQQVVEGDVAQQTERVLENLKGILEGAGSSLDRVVKTTVYLKDLADFAAMNEVYARYFSSSPPARATVEVARLPKEARVEIELIALA